MPREFFPIPSPPADQMPRNSIVLDWYDKCLGMSCVLQANNLAISPE